MEALLSLFEQSSLAQWMRVSRWGYASVNTLHVLGIALLVGAIVPLDLRLLGWWRNISLEPLARLLQSAAITGLLLVLATGPLLFIGRATEYAAQPLFLIKLSLIALAITNALVLNLGSGLASASALRLRIAGGISLLLWPAIVIAGRFLGFVAD
ncbi:hypothetical protein L861_06850 [Litchfieldella anticariensis FP35 = DSM 16096]|uniref:DUF2214 domain-containing protein n=1 Tax=Litchfieldella anticariensis (strain DSM 16096 / CECT 5854 / CIP 108499 / LMG 22089 / FP35) TaxID=1121939 RepID=S2KEC3_LITA3|nr:hypothetical protein [Halomonas anticariensis]EPC00205.1 hypothetical protein L861_06850 [Halomonas anticariensis FP35 = DSM 16096]